MKAVLRTMCTKKCWVMSNQSILRKSHRKIFGSIVSSNWRISLVTVTTFRRSWNLMSCFPTAQTADWFKRHKVFFEETDGSVQRLGWYSLRSVKNMFTQNLTKLFLIEIVIVFFHLQFWLSGIDIRTLMIWNGWYGWGWAHKNFSCTGIEDTVDVCDKSRNISYYWYVSHFMVPALLFHSHMPFVKRRSYIMTFWIKSTLKVNKCVQIRFYCLKNTCWFHGDSCGTYNGCSYYLESKNIVRAHFHI